MHAFDWVSSPEGWVALLTLTILEIVLGIDNIIFIAILAAKLPPQQRERARVMGLLLALITRIGLLMSISWVMGLTEDLVEIYDHGISGRDLILLVGGLFLLAKSTHEIHGSLEGEEDHGDRGRVVNSFAATIFQILVLDIVFSLDSVITAVGMAESISIMVIAVVVAVLVMLFAAKSIAAFVERHPTVKMLALAFLLLIGMSLVAEGFGQHIPKGYIYFAMGFSVLVEMLNLRVRAKVMPVHLHHKKPE
jgi:predicted tellurium resistance membrane protein TerC